MTWKEEYSRLTGIRFDDFRRRASDPTLSAYEKTGFPDSYREGMEPAIHADIVAKLLPLQREGAVVLDIGPGCTDLPRMLIEDASRLGQSLHLVDCEEMLALLPDGPNITKTAAIYPDCPELLETLAGRVDAIIVYSVLQCVFLEANVWRFLDATLGLLAPGGHLLFGDMPNVSMRKRFFASDAGKAFHREFTGQDEDPVVKYNTIDAGLIDDAVVFGLLQRARAAGFHAYVLPQPLGLPMQNRREDMLIIRP